MPCEADSDLESAEAAVIKPVKGDILFYIFYNLQLDLAEGKAIRPNRRNGIYA